MSVKHIYDIVKNKVGDIDYTDIIKWSSSFDDHINMLIIDLNGEILYASTAFAELSNYKKDELIGVNTRSFNSGYHDNYFYKTLWDTILSGNVWKGTFKNLDKFGNYFWLNTTIFPFTDKNNKVKFFLVIRSDTTPYFKKIEEIKEKYDANKLIDNYSGLFNELKLKEDLTHFTKSKLFFITISFSEFNYIINKYKPSDIKLMWEQLKERSDEYGLNLYKVAKDHVVFVFNDDCIGNYKKYRKHLKKLVNDPFIINNDIVYLNMNKGICICDKTNIDLEDSLRKSEIALFTCKINSKDEIIYTDEIGRIIERKMLIEQKIPEGLENEEFYLVFQPKLELKTNKMVGVESLLRWNNKELGEIYPSEFIPIAEEKGYIIELGEKVLTEACKKLREWYTRGIFDLKVGINISVKQFKNIDFISTIKRIIRHYDINPKNIDLEITENEYLSPHSKGFEKIKQLKELGITVSIDDFGKEYSSLGYLKTLSANTLKIDKMFISDMINSEQERELVKYIIGIGKLLGMKVLAEGVENADELKYLREYGCDEVQGFYFSKPLKESDFLSYYKKINKIST